MLIVLLLIILEQVDGEEEREPIKKFPIFFLFSKLYFYPFETIYIYIYNETCIPFARLL